MFILFTVGYRPAYHITVLSHTNEMHREWLRSITIKYHKYILRCCNHRSPKYASL